MKPLAIVLVLIAIPAVAQTVEITPFAGFRWGGQIDDSQNALNRDLDLESNGSYGVVVDFPLLGRNTAGATLELSASRQGTELVTDPGLFGEGGHVSNVDVSYYHAGIALEFPGDVFGPFIAFSIGATTLEPDAVQLDNETRFSGSIGGGVKVWIARNVGFRFEARGYMTALDDNDDDDFCARFNCDNNWNTLNQGEARLGVIFSF